MLVNNTGYKTLVALLLCGLLRVAFKTVTHLMPSQPAQAAVTQPSIPSKVNPDWECVLYDAKVCYVWRQVSTGKFYDNKGNEVANPFP
jgi:hypothetical protein